MRRLVLAFALVLVAGPAAAPTAAAAHDDDAYPLFHVAIAADADARDEIGARGLDVTGHDLPAGLIYVLATESDLAWLVKSGFSFEIVETRDGPQPLSGDAGVDVPLSDMQYTDPAELEAFLLQVAADHPSITRLVALGTSVEGRTIWGMMISDNAAVDEDELAVLFNGQHHAREVMTVEIVMDTIDFLTDNYDSGTADDTKPWVDSLQIWCVPSVNPDGNNRVHQVDDNWRKNLRDNDSSGTTTSQDGVDLNRNYEWGWGNQCQGSSSTFSSQTYRGPSEASEPEAQAMVALGRAIRPVFDVEYHSYGEDVFYALSCDPTFSPTLSTITGGSDQRISRVIAEAYASTIVQADGGVGYTSAPYGSRVDGTGRDQQYFESGAISFVTEVNTVGEGGFRPSYSVYRQPTVEGQRPGWQFLLDRVTGPAVGGLVTDAVTGLPVAADVSLDEMTLPANQRLASRADTGRYHIIVVPGAYTLRVAAPGYEDALVPVIVGASWIPTDVALVPTGASRIVFEDFEDAGSVSGWTAGAPGDDANDGFWEWGEPNGTHSGSIQGGDLEFGNPRVDATPGEGKLAFVTGNEIGAGFSTDDVDSGETTLLSPVYDLSGLYGVSVTWHRWFGKETAGNQDELVAEVSDDSGGSWSTLELLAASTVSADGASPAWVPVTFTLDDLFAPGPGVQLRFIARDDAGGNVVEAGVDDLEIRGFSLEAQGRVSGIVVTDAASTVVSWNAVPGGAGATYDVVRGEVASLSGGPGSVSLGALTCIEDDSSDLDTAGSPDATLPATGTARFYLVRFQLGFSVGDYGAGTQGVRSGTGGCP